jgi:hypothetical protein
LPLNSTNNNNENDQNINNITDQSIELKALKEQVQALMSSIKNSNNSNNNNDHNRNNNNGSGNSYNNNNNNNGNNEYQAPSRSRKATKNANIRVQGYNKEGYAIIYCHTHGTPSRNLTHNSCSCKYPGDMVHSAFDLFLHQYQLDPALQN